MKDLPGQVRSDAVEMWIKSAYRGNTAEIKYTYMGIGVTTSHDAVMGYPLKQVSGEAHTTCIKSFNCNGLVETKRDRMYLLLHWSTLAWLRLLPLRIVFSSK